MRDHCKAVVGGDKCGREKVAHCYCDPHYRHTKDGGSPRRIRDFRPSRAVKHRDAKGNKQCRTCGEWKSEGLFFRSSGTSDGLQVFCKDCDSKSSKSRHKDDPTRRRRTFLRRKYGITLEDFTDMLERQGGRCGICRTTSPMRDQWHVDHDHSHHKNPQQGCPSCVRGILCGACNMALGLLGDSVVNLRSALEYLGSSSR